MLLGSSTAAGVARAQISPGPLASAHGQLDRPSACFECHSKRSPRDPLDPQCLACHREVEWTRAHARGYHPKVREAACAKCHPDHGGRDFHLIAWEGGAPEKFDHRLAGWPLQGKHQSLECRSCHKPELRKSPAVALAPRGGNGPDWIGLERACAACHNDPHRGQLGAECQTCHGQRAWAPTSGFDHAKTEYPLTGAHAKVDCMTCHAAPGVATAHDAGGKALPQWKPLAHDECSSCHRDPHAGRFGAACARCHVTSGFKTMSERGFDHDRTRYPLRGAHAQVACASCHDPKAAWGRRPRFQRCGDCHADAHAGQATISGQAADCASCHVVSGFQHSNFTVAAHADAYPLEGAHGRAECGLCHRRLAAGARAAAPLGTARVVMRPVHEACVDCHADPHAGRFRPGGARGRAQDCLACHQLHGFEPSSFDVAAHEHSLFPLAGAHRAVPCQSCHAELKAPPPGSTLLSAAHALTPMRFEVAGRKCADCHASPHGKQFDARRDGGDCRACHGVDAFTPATTFDHNRDAAFKLQGAHARAACASCHRTERDARGRARVVYRPLSSACESCHGDGSSGTQGDASPARPARRSTFALLLTTHEVTRVPR